MTARVIDVRASNLLPSLSEELKPFDDIQWKSVLDSLAGHQMYRRHVHVRIRGRAVLRFLLKEELFPRTVYYSLSEVEQCLRGLPGNEPALRILGRALRMVQEVDVTEILTEGLESFIEELLQVHAQLNEQLTATYFDALESKSTQLQAAAS